MEPIEERFIPGLREAVPAGPEAVPVSVRMNLRSAVRPPRRELDAGGAVIAAVVAPALGALGYLAEHMSELAAVLETAGVPEGTVTAVLFGIGLTWAAVTKGKQG